MKHCGMECELVDVLWHAKQCGMQSTMLALSGASNETE